MEVTLESHITQLVNILTEQKCANYVARINSAGTLLEKAIQCIIGLPNLPFLAEISQCRNIILAILECPGVIDALADWRDETNRSVLDLPMDSFFLINVVRKISEEEFQTKAKQYILKPSRPWDAYRLVHFLNFDEADKLKCEELWNDIYKRYYAFSTDRIICRIWLQAAKQLPSSNDLEVATKMIIKEVQVREIDPILTELLEAFPHVDGETVVAAVNHWPDLYAKLTARFIRKENPYWILQGILRTTIEDCNYNWIRKQLAKKTVVNERAIESNFYLFEELPEDIIYYLISHMHFTHLIALSLTNKRMFKLVNESQHAWGQIAKKYFTKIPVASATDFRRKYQSKFLNGKLLHHFTRSRWVGSNKITAIELNGDKIIAAEENGVTVVENHCFSERKSRNRKKLKFVGLPAAAKRSARLLNDRIYTLSARFGDNQPSTFTVLDAQKKYSVISEKNVECTVQNLYFTVDTKALLAKGFEIDLTTQQITKLDWNANMSHWIVRDELIYGLERKDSNSAGPARITLFDQRTPEKLAAELNFERFRCFNVKDNDIYVVSTHIMQWDKRHLAHPVRTSTDPYFHWQSRKTPQYPTIDLTSMTVIGPDQIWDLTEFKWQLPELPREKTHIISNGILIAYMSTGTMNVRQNACTKDLSAPIVTYPELTCNIPRK